jgi:hypothetical protein
MAVQDLVTEEDMRELGLMARELMVDRTRRGVDVNGQPFAPYSEAYAKQKRAALGSTGVNLEVSGNMLNQITIVDLEDDSVTLGWAQ